MSEPTSIFCDRRDHAACDGIARIIDQDGSSRYICQCSCHTQHATCAHCGRGIQRQKGGTWLHGLRGSDKCAPTYATPAAASGGDGEGTGNDG